MSALGLAPKGSAPTVAGPVTQVRVIRAEWTKLPVLWAKVIVLAGLVLPVTLLCAVVDFFTATALESSRGGSAISLTDPGVLRTVVGSSLYLTVVVIIGLALGALLRKTAAGLSVFAAVFFLVPIVVGALRSAGLPAAVPATMEHRGCLGSINAPSWP